MDAKNMTANELTIKANGMREMAQGTTPSGKAAYLAEAARLYKMADAARAAEAARNDGR